MATTDAVPQASPSWLIKEKTTLPISTQASELAGMVLEPLKRGERIVGDEPFQAIHAAIDDDPEIAKELVRLFGFPDLIKDNHGQKYFQMDSADHPLMLFDKAIGDVEGGHGTTPSPLDMVFEVVGNGMPQDEAQMILDEVVRDRTLKTNVSGKNANDTLFHYSFKNHRGFMGYLSVPQWVKERYGLGKESNQR